MSLESQHRKFVQDVRAGRIRADEATYQPFHSRGCPHYHVMFHDDCAGCVANHREAAESREVDRLRRDLNAEQRAFDRINPPAATPRPGTRSGARADTRPTSRTKASGSSDSSDGFGCMGMLVLGLLFAAVSVIWLLVRLVNRAGEGVHQAAGHLDGTAGHLAAWIPAISIAATLAAFATVVLEHRMPVLEDLRKWVLWIALWWPVGWVLSAQFGMQSWVSLATVTALVSYGLALAVAFAVTIASLWWEDVTGKMPARPTLSAVPHPRPVEDDGSAS